MKNSCPVERAIVTRKSASSCRAATKNQRITTETRRHRVYTEKSTIGGDAKSTPKQDFNAEKRRRFEKQEQKQKTKPKPRGTTGGHEEKAKKILGRNTRISQIASTAKSCYGR